MKDIYEWILNYVFWITGTIMVLFAYFIVDPFEPLWSSAKDEYELRAIVTVKCPMMDDFSLELHSKGFSMRRLLDADGNQVTVPQNCMMTYKKVEESQ